MRWRKPRTRTVNADDAIFQLAMALLEGGIATNNKAAVEEAARRLDQKYVYVTEICTRMRACQEVK